MHTCVMLHFSSTIKYIHLHYAPLVLFMCVLLESIKPMYICRYVVLQISASTTIFVDQHIKQLVLTCLHTHEHNTYVRLIMHCKSTNVQGITCLSFS